MTLKTDNHFLADKARLRANHLPEGKTEIRVLDVFGGKGIVWDAVERISGKKIVRTAIDKRTDLRTLHFHGDNSRILSELDLTNYDVIDLDAYGIPSEQLRIVFLSKFKGKVFVTAIQTMNGQMPTVIAHDLGFPERAIREASSLIARRGWQYLKEWLAMNGVKEIHHRSWGRKHYLMFEIADDATD